MDTRYRLIISKPGQQSQEFVAPIEDLADILNQFGIVADLGPLQSLAAELDQDGEATLQAASGTTVTFQKLAPTEILEEEQAASQRFVFEYWANATMVENDTTDLTGVVARLLEVVPSQEALEDILVTLDGTGTVTLNDKAAGLRMVFRKLTN